MAMKKRLSKHGNSRSLVIEKPILDLLQITDETMLELKTDGTSLILTPINDDGESKKFSDSVKAVLDKKQDSLSKVTSK